jgi:hypothetical protein
VSGFALAPPAVAVDGLLGVPIGVQQLTATLTFDAAARSATADATLDFVVGPTSGNGIFDLRQTVTAAQLDGVDLTPADVAHHDLGGGPGSKLRLIGTSLAAGTAHSLRLQYTLATPDAGGARPVGFDPAAPRLRFDLWMSDLFPGRYLEMWLPANLIWDAHPTDLDVRIDNAVAHALFSNGEVTVPAANQWHVSYPARFSAFSPMLVVLPADEIATRSGSVSLAGSPSPVSLDLFKLTTEPASLATVETELAGYMTDDVASTGVYTHGDRFTAYVWSEPSRSMEYDGATTSNRASLRHETFHSWWGRGVKPASQDDGWIDEAWNEWMTGGGPVATPFSLAEPPVQLAPPSPYSRVTPSASYSAGRRFFEGLAAALGPVALRAAMADFYAAHRGRRITTADLEAFLLARSGEPEIVHWFHRWVYGFADPPASMQPDVWLADAPGDPGLDAFGGPVFWASPDVWARNSDDGGTAPQAPEFGQDNWLYARVHNRGSGVALSYAVAFNAHPWAGTEFTYPGDMLPAVAAVVGFGLAPGATQVVKARWPAAAVPATGTHACILAAALVGGDLPPSGRHVWEHNDLAQRNVTVIDVVAGDRVRFDFEVGSPKRPEPAAVTLEVVRPRERPKLRLALVGPGIRTLWANREPLRPPQPEPPVLRTLEPVPLSVGAVDVRLATDSTVMLAPERPAPAATGRGPQPASLRGKRIVLAPGRRAGLRSRLPARTALAVGLEVVVPEDVARGDELLVHVVQRWDGGGVAGGLGLLLRVGKET